MDAKENTHSSYDKSAYSAMACLTPGPSIDLAHSARVCMAPSPALSLPKVGPTLGGELIKSSKNKCSLMFMIFGGHIDSGTLSLTKKNRKKKN